MNEEILSRIKKIAERLKDEYKAERVILYGSYKVPLSPIILNPQEVKKRLERGDQFVEQILEKRVDL